jgi:hypothetical protein
VIKINGDMEMITQQILETLLVVAASLSVIGVFKALLHALTSRRLARIPVVVRVNRRIHRL